MVKAIAPQHMVGFRPRLLNRRGANNAPIAAPVPNRPMERYEYMIEYYDM